MTSAARQKLRALALLGAVSGAALATPGSASAAPPRPGCPLDGAHDGISRCDYEVFPLRLPAFETPPLPRPDPIPPYTP